MFAVAVVVRGNEQGDCSLMNEPSTGDERAKVGANFRIPRAHKSAG